MPIFFQIQDQIRKKIENEQLVPGERLPSERELSSQLGVSRVTVRRAMKGLINEGLCYKRVGKGLYVADDKITINLQNMSGTTSFIKKMGLKLETKLLEKSIINGGKLINSKLNNDNEKILYLKKVRFINGEPLMLEKTYLPLNRFTDIENEDLNQSLYELLKNKYNTVPENSRGTFNVKLAQKEESIYLNIPLNTALLEKEVVVFDKDSIPIEYNKTCYRSDKFSFVINSRNTDEDE